MENLYSAKQEAEVGLSLLLKQSLVENLNSAKQEAEVNTVIGFKGLSSYYIEIKSSLRSGCHYFPNSL